MYGIPGRLLEEGLTREERFLRPQPFQKVERRSFYRTVANFFLSVAPVH